MSKKVYVGNLNYATTEETLKNIFSEFGEVVSAIVIYDRMTQQSKGFGFVEFSDDSAAESAIGAMNGKEVDGRRIRVNTAEDRPPRPKFNGSAQ